MENKQHKAALLQKIQTQTALPVEENLFCPGVCRQRRSSAIVLYHLAWKKRKAVSHSYPYAGMGGYPGGPQEGRVLHPEGAQSHRLALPRSGNVQEVGSSHGQGGLAAGLWVRCWCPRRGGRCWFWG